MEIQYFIIDGEDKNRTDFFWELLTRAPELCYPSEYTRENMRTIQKIALDHNCIASIVGFYPYPYPIGEEGEHGKKA